MGIENKIIETEVKTILYNGEPVEKDKFIEGGEYYQKEYVSTLSKEGIEQIGKPIKDFEIYVKESGWFLCVCY